MRRKAVVALAAGVVIIFVLLSLFFFRKPFGPKEIEKLRVGAVADPIFSLLYIAREKGLFKRHGIDISFEHYQAGAYAVDGLLAGKIDAAVASEFVLAFQALKQPDLRTIGTVSASDSIEMTARRDRGIEKPEDLRGKRIGVSKGTNAEFFLNTFLSLNGIHATEVQRVYLKPADIATALEEDKIDAAINLFSFQEAVKKNFGGRVLCWPAQGGQDFFFLLITKEELIKVRPRAIIGLLEGVLEAEAFIKNHEKEALDIVAHTLGLAPERVKTTWAKTRFRVRLDQELLTLMEDEARWAIRNKLVDVEKVPNYFNFLYLEGLGKIKPDAVTIIR